MHTISTIIHISHCSAYLRASIHVPTIERDVENASVTGTVESVKLLSIHVSAHQSKAVTAAMPAHTAMGV